jgi:ribosomal protein S12 methylthiotransferase accessory factor
MAVSGKVGGAATLLARWDDLVDPRTGVVAEVYPLRVDNDEPDFFHFMSTAADTAAFTALPNFRQNGGVSTDRYVAMAKALGEAIERYCAAVFRYRDLIVAPYAQLDVPATAPSRYALYRPEQHEQPGFPWSAFTDDAPVAWTAATSMLDGSPVLVPAAFVYAPYHYLGGGREVPIAQPISTGLAAGTSVRGATLSGLCEAIERDAFTITWQSMLAHRRIRTTTLPPAARAVVERFTDVGLRVELMDATTDIACPTVLSICIGSAATSPAVTIAAATDPDPVRAAVKSVEELAHTRKFARQIMWIEPPVELDVAGGHPAVQEQRHHLRLYCDQESVAYIEWAWSSDRWCDLADLEPLAVRGDQDPLDALIAAVADVGLEPLSIDLTTPDVAELGLAVVRVVVPGLHPMHIGHVNRALGGRRLYEVPAELGFTPLLPGQPDNPYPHPFP